MLPSDPVITEDAGGFRVSVIRNGRVDVYSCDTKAEAERFAQVLRAPTVDRPTRKVIRSPRRAVAGSGLSEPIALFKMPARWRGW